MLVIVVGCSADNGMSSLRSISSSGSNSASGSSGSI